MKKPKVFEAILTALSQYPKKLALMLQATPEIDDYKKKAHRLGLTIYGEAFADRCYDDEGRLLSRSETGAVLTRAAMLAQVKQLAEQGTITTISGKVVPLTVDSLCVHGDNLEGVRAIAEIKALISECR